MQEKKKIKKKLFFFRFVLDNIKKTRIFVLTTTRHNTATTNRPKGQNGKVEI
jgi:hypothetical protein